MPDALPAVTLPFLAKAGASRASAAAEASKRMCSSLTIRTMSPRLAISTGTIVGEAAGARTHSPLLRRQGRHPASRLMP